MFIIQVVIGCVFSMNVISFNCVEVCTSLVLMQYLHGVFNGVEGVCMFIEMLCEFGTAAVNSECVLVFVVPYSEISSCLSNKSFLTISACQFV